jgi:hypothetical protein
MVKWSTSEAVAEWRAAEANYRAVVDEFLAEGSVKRIDKDAAVEIVGARARADKRLDALLRRLLE